MSYRRCGWMNGLHVRTLCLRTFGPVFIRTHIKCFRSRSPFCCCAVPSSLPITTLTQPVCSLTQFSYVLSFEEGSWSPKNGGISLWPHIASWKGLLEFPTNDLRPDQMTKCLARKKTNNKLKVSKGYICVSGKPWLFLKDLLFNVCMMKRSVFQPRLSTTTVGSWTPSLYLITTPEKRTWTSYTMELVRLYSPQSLSKTKTEAPDSVLYPLEGRAKIF